MSGDSFTPANRTMTPALRRLTLCGLLAVIGLGQWELTLAMAEDSIPAASEGMGKWIAELDSDQFHVRRHAADKLRALAEQPAAQEALAAALSRLLLRADTPYEVRELCEPLLLRLPAPKDVPGPGITAAEIDLLVAQADADLYGQRIGATTRLGWAAKRSPELARLVAEKVKRRLADVTLSRDARVRLAAVRETAWLAWLASDPAAWPAPTATEESMQGWIKTLVSRTETSSAQDAAEGELIDLLVYDAWTSRIRDVIAEHLESSENLTPEALERLARLHDLCQPAMAAEIWVERTHNTVQYLLVDVPQRVEHAERTTHFDRIDDQVAHCVSGNSLAPGDYPVGIGLPPTHPLNPAKEGRMFHLVNLPTPRRRLLYDHQQLKVDEPQRLRELSERTTAYYLNRKQCLAEREIALLRQLDPTVVSRFVGPYLLAVDDQPKAEPEDFQFGGRSSRHVLLCAIVAEIGTHEALPGLVEAGRRGRLPPPNEDLKYNVGWLAAMAIADRDPWPGLDDWLASLIEMTDPLGTSHDPSPDVGGTAAAMLLERQGVSLSDFGVVEVNDADLRGMSIPAARFVTPTGRRQVLDWWQRHKQQAKSPGA
jgi:hypothetical protein